MFETRRLKTRCWEYADIDIAQQLWGDPAVTQFIDVRDSLTLTEVNEKLLQQIKLQERYGMQYWILIEKQTGHEIGCCGLRPYNLEHNVLEIGFHIMQNYWGNGFATEAARGAIDYAFTVLKCPKIFAGHNPRNTASKKIIEKLGFTYIGDEFYEPANAYHPSYELINPNIA